MFCTFYVLFSDILVPDTVTSDGLGLVLATSATLYRYKKKKKHRDSRSDSWNVDSVCYKII